MRSADPTAADTETASWFGLAARLRPVLRLPAKETISEWKRKLAGVRSNMRALAETFQAEVQRLALQRIGIWLMFCQAVRGIDIPAPLTRLSLSRSATE